MLVAVLDGAAVVAVEGAIAAMHSQLDLFGVMVIAFIVALRWGWRCLPLRAGWALHR